MKNYFPIIFLCVVSGCNTPSYEPSQVTDKSKVTQQTVLNLYVMPDTVPENLEKRFAWGLWNLDKEILNDSIAADINPYNLAQVVDVSHEIPNHKQLSPYALIMEGYLARTKLEENTHTIIAALHDLYDCVELLIQKKVSVDEGILTFGSHATMRDFAHESLTRLTTEKNSQTGLDEEGRFALDLWQKIQVLIDTYQPN